MTQCTDEYNDDDILEVYIENFDRLINELDPLNKIVYITMDGVKTALEHDFSLMVTRVTESFPKDGDVILEAALLSKEQYEYEKEGQDE